MMKKLKNISVSKKTIPWFLLLTSILSFGLLIPSLGFYQDDWHHIFYFSQGGADGLKQFLFTDSRPFAYLIYVPLFKLLGTKPITWQVAALFFRFLIVLSFWGVLNQIWKEAYKRNAIVASLFLIYPVFLLQPMSVMFALHWTMYLVYMLSLLLMLKAAQNSRYFIALMGLALVLELFHLVMMEYFVGIEFLRPIFLFMLLRKMPLKNRLLRTLKLSLPFLLITLLYIIFRSSFSTIFSHDRNIPVVLFRLLEEPLPTIGYLVQVLFQDFSEILITSWYGTIEPVLFSFKKRYDLLIWLGVLLFSGFFWAYFSVLSPHNEDKKETENWAKGLMVLGLFGVLFGVAPGWAVGKTVHGSNPLWNDRFAMASMFGAAMFWVGLIFFLLKKNSHILLVLGLMVSLAIGANLRSALNYKQSWDKQQKFYWQLYWRAPAIEKDTAFIADSEFVSYMGVYPTSFAINTLYQNTTDVTDVNYWLYVAGERLPKWEAYRAGAELDFHKYDSDFQGYSLNSLPILFEPENLQCLWILQPEDQANRSLPEITYAYLSASNPDRIQAKSVVFPSESIFGKEPAHNRCYYYEKAALAHQFRDWDKVLSLWDEAEQSDLLPYNGVEYIPFIEAFARTGDWDKANVLTLKANLITERMSPYLCDIWLSLNYQDAPDDLLENLSNRLSCATLVDEN